MDDSKNLSDLERIFLPIVKPEKMKEFKETWGEWLVLTNEIEDKRCPGKLKIEFLTFDGEMISLAPKSYFAFCRKKSEIKDGRKG